MQLYNEIKSHFILPDAYTDWKNYRNTLTDYLIRQTDQVELPLSFHAGIQHIEILPTLLILGAGACNDLDLMQLTRHFSKITLMDYDETALQTALTTYDLMNSKQVECLSLSLNGITDNDYCTFCGKLQSFVQEQKSVLTPDNFETYAISLVESYYQKSHQNSIPLPADTYDYIWCFGVHSQLQTMFSYIYHAFDVNLKNSLFPDTEQTACQSGIRFNNRLKAENDVFIPHLHDAMLSCAKKGIFLGLEQKRMDNEEAIEGAYQAIKDIERRDLHLAESRILWPFYPEGNLYYEMLIEQITL